MLTKSNGLAVVFAATAFGLFGMPERAKADAITVGTVSQVPGRLQITGSGTFSVNPGRKLDSIKMVVQTLQGKVVSTSPGTNPAGTTEWGSNSIVLPAGTYNVGATIKTTDLQGQNPIETPSQNTLQITIK